MPDEPVTEARPVLPWDEAHQVQFNFFRGAVFGKAQALGKPLHVGVNHDALGGAESVAKDNVGGLASDAWQCGERLEGAGHLSVV